MKITALSGRLTQAFEGGWEAVSQTGGVPHRVVLRLWPAVDGTALAALTTGGQDGREHQVIPVTTVTLSDSPDRPRRLCGAGHVSWRSQCKGRESSASRSKPDPTIPLTFMRQPHADKKH